MAASAYHVRSKEVENHIFKHKWIFRQLFMYKQPTLTKQWNNNVFVQILYSYFRCTGRLFLGCALFVARCNINRASCEITFWLHALLTKSFFVAFFFYSLPFPKWHNCWMAPIRVHNIAMGGIRCDDVKSGQKYENLL